MNWYKIAITKKEFYEFYALQGLDDETLKENPDFLFDLIEKVNSIQAYYCKYLIKGIASELSYGSKNKSIINKEGEEYNCTQIKDYLLILSDKLCEENMSSNLDIISELNKFLELAERGFKECSFNTYYGGDAWAEITKWTKKFLNFQPITYENLNFNKLREFVMIIDVINSLEHNTNFALNRLPEQESFWLPAALEVVKLVKNPVLLADLANNSKLSELYRRKILPLTNTKENVPDWMKKYDAMMGMEYGNYSAYLDMHQRRKDYIKSTNNFDFLKAVINSHLENYIDKIVYNPIIYTNDEIFKQLLDKAYEIDIIDILNEKIRDLSFLIQTNSMLENIKISETAFNYLLRQTFYDYDLFSILSENKYLSSERANRIFDTTLKFPFHIKNKFADLVYPNILNKLSPERKKMALEYLEEQNEQLV